MIKLILAILAVIFFLLAGFKVPAAVDWTNLGFACFAAAVLLPV